MLKIITPGSWNFDEPIVQIVKVASGGLRGDDLRSFIKRAGHNFADKIQNIDLSPGEVPVHLIALGATEFYGPNRNGDGFTEATCKKYHDTFRKNARWYRNHKNKDTKNHQGQESAWCEATEHSAESHGRCKVRRGLQEGFDRDTAEQTAQATYKQESKENQIEKILSHTFYSELRDASEEHPVFDRPEGQLRG